MRTGKRGDQLGWLDLVVAPDGEIVHTGGYPIVLDKEIEDDPATREAIKGFEIELRKRRSETGCSIRLAPDSALGIEACADCHREEHQRWQSSAHARALLTLAQAGGVQNPSCLTCHTSGQGKAVECGSCHDMSVTRTEHHAAVDSCQGCHDRENSPEFDRATYMEKIRHW
jgi:hypothetical protein